MTNFVKQDLIDTIFNRLLNGSVCIYGVRNVGISTTINSIISSEGDRKFLTIKTPNELNILLKKKSVNDKDVVIIDDVEKFTDYHLLKKAMTQKNIRFLLGAHHIPSFFVGKYELIGVTFIPVYPLSFKEFCLVKLNGLKSIDEILDQDLNAYLNEYLEFGGLPGVLKRESIEDKYSYLESLFSEIVQKDIMPYYEFNDSDTIRKVSEYLMANVSRPYKDLYSFDEPIDNIYYQAVEECLLFKKILGRHNGEEKNNMVAYLPTDLGLMHTLTATKYDTKIELSIILHNELLKNDFKVFINSNGPLMASATKDLNLYEFFIESDRFDKFERNYLLTLEKEFSDPNSQKYYIYQGKGDFDIKDVTFVPFIEFITQGLKEIL